jgi:hypothetical protein
MLLVKKKKNHTITADNPITINYHMSKKNLNFWIKWGKVNFTIAQDIF